MLSDGERKRRDREEGKEREGEREDGGKGDMERGCKKEGTGSLRLFSQAGLTSELSLRTEAFDTPDL